MSPHGPRQWKREAEHGSEWTGARPVPGSEGRRRGPRAQGCRRAPMAGKQEGHCALEPAGAQRGERARPPSPPGSNRAWLRPPSVWSLVTAAAGGRGTRGVAAEGRGGVAGRPGRCVSVARWVRADRSFSVGPARRSRGHVRAPRRRRSATAAGRRGCASGDDATRSGIRPGLSRREPGPALARDRLVGRSQPQRGSRLRPGGRSQRSGPKAGARTDVRWPPGSTRHRSLAQGGRARRVKQLRSVGCGILPSLGRGRTDTWHRRPRASR